MSYLPIAYSQFVGGMALTTTAMAKSPSWSSARPVGTLANTKSKVRGYVYDMSGHVSASVDRYLEFSGKPRSSSKLVATPCIDDHQLDLADDLKWGELKDECATIVPKALYCARMNRTSLLGGSE